VFRASHQKPDLRVVAVDINNQQNLLSDKAFGHRYLEHIYKQLNCAKSFDSFSFAWDRAKREFKAAVLFVAYRNYPSYFKGPTPESPAENYSDFQKNILLRISQTLTEEGVKAFSTVQASNEVTDPMEKKNDVEYQRNTNS
jgi:hypothetical protein